MITCLGLLPVPPAGEQAEGERNPGTRRPCKEIGLAKKIFGPDLGR